MITASTPSLNASRRPVSDSPELSGERPDPVITPPSPRLTKILTAPARRGAQPRPQLPASAEKPQPYKGFSRFPPTLKSIAARTPPRDELRY